MKLYEVDMQKKFLQQNMRARIKLRAQGRAWVKLRRMMLALIAAAALAIPAAAMAMEMEVDIPYEQDFTNDSARASVADTFNYRLTADSSAPMPSGTTGGAYDFSLTGDTKGVLKLDISYAKPGYYDYTIRSNESSPQTGYTYESKVYKVMVMIVNGSDGLVPGAITIKDASSGNKYDNLLFEPSFYEQRPSPDPGPGPNPGPDPGPDPGPNPDPNPDPNPNPNPNGGGGGGNAGNAGVAGAGAVAGAPADGNPAPGPPTNIEDTDPPLAGIDKGDDYWALINLIAMILTCITAILGLIFYIRRRNQASKLEDRNEEALQEAAASGTQAELEDVEDPDKLKRKGIVRIVNIVVAIISLILFILTEDMTLPMQLVDEWTIWMIILLVIALILALVSRKVTKEPEEEQGDHPEPAPGT